MPSNLLPFPLIHDAMSDEDIELHVSGSIAKLLGELVDVELERDCYRSAFVSVSRRLEVFQVRRLRWLVAGGLVGALVGWTIDGSFAQVLDRALRAVGL